MGLLPRSAFTIKGSFRVEIRTEAKGKGEILAKQGNVMATSSFNKVIVGFEEQPKLEAGKTYFMEVILEKGGFKFQSIRDTKNPPYFLFSGKSKTWVDDGSIAYVVKPNYATTLPKRGDQSGMLSVKDVRRVDSLTNRKKCNSLPADQRTAVGCCKQCNRPRGICILKAHALPTPAHPTDTVYFLAIRASRLIMQVTKKKSRMSVRKRTAYQAGKAVKKFAVLEGDTLRLYVNVNCTCVILPTSIDAPSPMYSSVNLLYKVARRSYDLKQSTFVATLATHPTRTFMIRRGLSCPYSFDDREF